MDETTEEIRRRADIVEIVSQHVALRNAGGERFKACCPFHDEKTPSFYVSRDKGFYKCFGCGVSGDIFKFLQQIENITFPEAKRQLAERYGIALPKNNREYSPEQLAAFEERDRLLKVTAACAAFFREQFAGNKGLEARDYARRRGLSGTTIEKFAIGAAPDAWDALHHHLVNKHRFSIEDCVAAGVLIAREREENGATRISHYDRYRHRLMFPIWDAQGRVIAFGGRALEGGQTGTPDAKYINSPEGPLFNKSKILYAWHVARPEVGKRESIIITEGYMDAIALHEAGFGNTVATLGTALTALHVSDLARLAPKTVYLCYDGDSAGMKAALRSAALFAQHELTVRVVALPSGDDPDTFIRKNGAHGFEKALQRAQMLTRYRIEMAIEPFDLAQLSQRMEAIRAASDIVAGVRSDIEKDDYVAWLSERWAQAEGVTAPTRLQMIQAAVRREVGQAVKRLREEARNQARAKNGAPPVSQDDASTREAGSAFNNKREWLPREEFLRRKREEENGSPSLKSGEEIGETLTLGEGALSGVAKAERILLASLLGNPSWRTRILGDMPPHLWTRETHREIAQALRQIDWNEPVDASTLIETLPTEAADLVGELILSDQAQTVATEEVLRDCVARVRGYWARRQEQELLEMIKLKLESGERISDEERENLNAALIATRRKKPSGET